MGEGNLGFYPLLDLWIIMEFATCPKVPPRSTKSFKALCFLTGMVALVGTLYWALRHLGDLEDPRYSPFAQ